MALSKIQGASIKLVGESWSRGNVYERDQARDTGHDSSLLAV